MRQYLDVMQDILSYGYNKADRTGTGTRSVFGRQMRFNILRDGFPLLTTKKLHLRSITYELLWFLRGENNLQYLHDNGVSIWDEWADDDGYLGPIYGVQWRSWPKYSAGYIDQIARVIAQLRHNPDDRRIIVSAWNVDMIEEMRLPPCHLLFQFYSHELTLPERSLWYARRLDTGQLRGRPEGLHEELDRLGIPRRGLSCQLYQRSCDWFLGVPFNIASYAMFTMMVAQVTNHVPFEFIWTGGDCHLYRNHFDQAREQLSRRPKELPWMKIDPEVMNIDSFRYESFRLVGYDDPHPHISAPISK